MKKKRMISPKTTIFEGINRGPEIQDETKRKKRVSGCLTELRKGRREGGLAYITH
jgi:hypothetical protein